MRDDVDDGPPEQDNFDIERNELLRLMGTAKDDYRKSIIQESLNSLSSPERKPTKAGALQNAFETEKVGRNFSKSPPIRPVSARLRRPSMNNLDVIQEEKRLSVEKLIDSKDDSHVTFIHIDDVYEFSTSSFDPNLSNWNPFRHGITSSPHPSLVHSTSKHGGNIPKIHYGRWVATGLLPQFLSIDLKLCWLILEVQVVGQGIEEVSLSIEGSLHKSPMTRENSTTFTFSSTSLKDPTSGLSSSNSFSLRSSPSKTFGDRVLLTFEKASDVFFIVDSVRIQALPTGT